MDDREMLCKELLALKEQIVQEIRFTKTQIWNTTYLTILAISAIIAAYLYINQGNAFYHYIFRVFFIIPVTLIGLLGVIVVNLHQNTLGRNRKGLERIKLQYKYVFYLTNHFKIVEDEDIDSRNIFRWLHKGLIIGALIIGVYILHFA